MGNKERFNLVDANSVRYNVVYMETGHIDSTI